MKTENLSKESIISFLRENKVFLKNEFDINHIGLFGSYARDEAHKESDIDLVIDTSTKNFDNRMRLKEYLEEHFQRPVDVCYFDSLRTFIKRSIEKELIYA